MKSKSPMTGISNAKLFILSLLIALILGEGGLRVYLKFFPKRIDALSGALSENFFFHTWKPGEKLHPNFQRFDPTVGWRAGPVDKPDTSVYNAQGYRNLFDFVEHKERPRVILVGDSFIQGIGVGDNETIPFHLAESLGPGVEVFNMGVEGFAVDQMAVMATEVAPRYQPDAVILSFIADDLKRTCLTFAWGHTKKPYFVRTGDGLRIEGIPLPTPQENARLHERPAQKIADALAAWATKSRLLTVVANPYLEYKRSRCINELNADILAYTKKRLEGRAKVIFAHLDGELLDGFRRRVKQSGIELVDIPAILKKRNFPAGRSDDYHFDSPTCKIVAQILADELKNQGLNTEGRHSKKMSALPHEISEAQE